MASSLKLRHLNSNISHRFLSSSSNTMKNHFDIIIAGGGMVGSAIACALKKNPKLANKRILMLEGGSKRTISKPKNYSNRVVSLNPGTRKFFEKIGIWQHIYRYNTVKKLQVWDSNSDAVITFNHENYSDVSYIVENNLILDALQQELTNCKADIEYETKIESIELPNDNSGMLNSKYSYDLLIGAEGFNSATRKAMQSQWLAWNYSQHGVVATLKLAEPTENVVAWQRFLPNGPIALLPLTNELSSLVWTTTPSKAKELVQMTDDSFVNAVNNGFWKTENLDPVVSNVSNGLNRILESLSLASTVTTNQQLPPSVISVVEKSRASFPLGFGHAARYVAPGAALVGDAAHRVHPLAGQGVNLGFGDVECLAEVIANAVYSGQKLNTLDYLLEYERKRQCHNFPTMLAIDALQKLYNSSITPIVVLRSIGMQITNSLKPVKRAIMNHASQ